MLIDRGIRRTGKEGASNPANTQASNLTGVDQRGLQAIFRQKQRRQACPSGVCLNSPAEDYMAIDRDYEAIDRLKRRKYKGGATFTREDML